MRVSKLALAAFLSLTLATPSLAMNKGELVDSIAKDANLSKADAKRALESLTSNVTRRLRRGERAALVGFGTFSISSRAARTGRNPQTGATIQIKAKKVSFDVDRPLAEATYPLFIQNFWNDVNTINAQNLRGITINSSSTVNSKIQTDREVKSAPMRPDVFFDIMSRFGSTFGQMLTDENPSSMLNEESRKSYVELLGKYLSSSDKGRELAAHEAAHVLQQRAGRNMASAVQALVTQATRMEKRYLDDDSDGDGFEDLLRRSGRKAKLDKEQMGAAYKAFVSNVTGALKKGDRVSLIGFGTFSISARAARSGRNPQTGATIQIKAKKVAKFKAGKALADKVN